MTKLNEMTTDELTESMAALETSGATYEEVAEEYEALSAERTRRGWVPEWVRALA